MKVFISGSKHINELDEKVMEIIRGYVNNGDEILVGDDDCGIDTLIQSCIKTYNNVTVYAPFKSARMNMGSWDVKRNEKGGVGRSTRWFNHESLMAVEADCCFMIWNGRSVDAFINMINLTSLKKPVLVYNTETKELTEIKSYAGLESVLPDNPDYVPSNDCLPKDLNEYVIKNCGLSKDIEKHFLDNPVSKRWIVDLVMSAYIPLEKKKRLFKRILPTDDFLHEPYRVEKHHDLGSEFHNNYVLSSSVFGMFNHCVLECSASKCYWEICEALSEQECHKGEVFTVKMCWYDTDKYEDKDYLESASSSFENAMRDVKDSIKFEMGKDFESFDKASNNSWYEIDKWTPQENGRLNISYTYYVERTSVINFCRSAKHHKAWFDDNLLDIADERFDGLQSRLDDDLICPFNHGDIVTIDASPFADVFHAVVIRNQAEDGINLFLFYDLQFGVYHIGLLLSAAAINADNPKASFIHKMSRHKGKLYGAEIIFKKVSKWINGDKEKAKTFYDALYNEDCWSITTEEIERFLNENKNIQPHECG